MGEAEIFFKALLNQYLALRSFQCLVLDKASAPARAPHLHPDRQKLTHYKFRIRNHAK